MGADRGLVKPDLVFFMDIKPEFSAQRAGFGEERFEKLEFQSKVYEAFSQFKYDGCKDTEFNNNYWVNIDVAGLDIQQVHNRIRAVVDKY